MNETRTDIIRTTLRGIVVKSAMKDTVTVAVSRYVKHPKYKKFQKRMKKYLVHNPGNTAPVGSVVTIRATRPISARKHFEVVSVEATQTGVSEEASE